MTLDAHLVHLAALLRQNGIPVSTAELIDAAQAIALVGLDDRERLRATLAATLIKRQRHQARFERIFDLYFDGAARLLDALGESAAKAIERAGWLERGELERLATALQKHALALSELSRAALDGDGAALLACLRQAALHLDFSKLDGPAQQGFFARRLLKRAGMDATRQELAEIAHHLTARGLSDEAIDLTNRALKDVLKRVERAAAEWVSQEVRLRARHGESPDLAEQPFMALDAEEFAIVTRAVRRLAERLKTRLTCRRRQARRGRLDVRTTLRRNAGLCDGWPRLAFRRRRASRPELVILCDLSDSVRPTARTMLLFATTIQSLFARTRTFVFVNELREVTHLIKDVDPRRGGDLRRLSEAIDFGGNSHYGRVFAELAARESAALGRRTTLLVIGDGRGNYSDPGLDALDDIARRTGRLLWITPEPKSRWAESDCELWRYEKRCTRVATVACLADLEALADLLVPRQAC
ncbi:MAG: VWA domain-containing protein [Myxococcaceae bacterium]|nr:VWA domain-containing protein [Myxococcaceae bacterium]